MRGESRAGFARLVRATERCTQARQRAVEVGLHGRLRHVEHAPDLREGQLPETAQVDDRAKPEWELTHRLMQGSVQVKLLHDLLWHRSRIQDGLNQRNPFALIFPGEFREMNRRSTPLLAQFVQAAMACDLL